MKIEKLLDYNNSIKAIIDNAKDVNALVKFRLLSMCKQIEPVEEIVEKVRIEKLKQYGSTTADGSIGIFEPVKEDYENDADYNDAIKKYEKDVSSFQKDMNELLSSEADIEIKKFKPSDIFDAGLPADYLLIIYDLIEE